MTTTRGPVTGSRGFTLVEVMITVVVAGVLGGALMSLVHGQQRFYALSDGQTHARQNIRVVVDLMAAELRMASPGDIVLARSDSVTIRFDLVRGVVCGGGAGSTHVYAYDSVTNANLTGGIVGTAYSEPYDSAFVYADGFAGTIIGSDPASETLCRTNGAPTTEPSSAFRLVSGWSTTPPRGSLVRWYGTLTYAFAPSATDAGSLAIWRDGQELVTPFEAGAEFRYVMQDGSVQGSVTAGNLADIREIRVGATATGQGPFRARRAVVYDVPLRN